MGKWAARLAAHLADEKLPSPFSGAPPKPSKGGCEAFEGDGSRVRGAFLQAANDAALAESRPYRPSKADADDAHAAPWDDAACARFVVRVSLFLRRGIDATDADDLAERLHLRDLQADDRRLCLECRHLAGRAGTWRCGNHHAAGVGRELPRAMVTLAGRCPGFAEA